MNFALITEGASENRVIKHIISKYYKELEPNINQIQPRLLSTGKQDSSTPGGWNEVLKYCERDELSDILIENDFLIIQIDTDLSATSPFDVLHYDDNQNLKSDQNLYEDIINKLTGLIDSNLFDENKERIVFAISIHTIECWLLPLCYINNDRTKKSNCINKLNQYLRQHSLNIITADNKNGPNGINSYQAVLNKWKKKKDISKSSIHNFGFLKFIEALDNLKTE